MTGWTTTTLGEVVALQRGIDTTKATQLPGTVPVVSSSGISSYRFDAWAEGPGVIMGRKGTLGQVHYIEGPYWPHDTTLWVTDFKGNNEKFIYYFLKQLETGSMNVGSASPTLNRNHLYPLPVRVPPQEEQQAIAEVLGALDDKIAANTRMSQTSDALVRILYASLPSSTSVLGDFSDNVRDQVQPNGCIPYVGLEHVGRRHLWLHEQGTSDEVTSAKSVFQAGDVLFGKLRPYFHKVVSAPVDGICSTDILVLRAKEPALAGYVLAAAGSTEVVDHSTARSAGTKMPRASWADLSEAPIRWAGRGAAHRLSKIVTAVREATEAAIRESQTLAQLRDTLLPALMDGRLRVRDAVEQIEGKF